MSTVYDGVYDIEVIEDKRIGLLVSRTSDGYHEAGG